MPANMKLVRSIEMLFHFPRRVAREIARLYFLIRFWLYNRLGSKAVTQPGSPVVSLTTWGKRALTVYLAIESIAAGRVRPSRLILWIDDERLIRSLPATLRRLQRRGLEVKLSQNYGPHTKYYPYVESEQTFSVPLVTADDDVLYPYYWLDDLSCALAESPDTIHCFWTHLIRMDGDRMLGYKHWDWYGGDMKPRYRNLPLGVFGAAYPVSFLAVLRQAGAAFQDVCPKGDDLWIHVQALRSGFKVRQVAPRIPYFAFYSVPGSQDVALCHENVDRAGYDSQIKTLYSHSDLHLLTND